MAPKQKQSDETTSTVYVATRTAHIDVDGRREIIRKNVTRVAAGHDLLKRYPDLFKPADKDVRFGVEDAVTRPSSPSSRGERQTAGVKQGAARPDGTEPAPAVKPYSERPKEELVKEIKSRNHRRAEADKIKVPSRASVATLAELLAQDDATPVETGVLEPADGDGEGTVVSDKTKRGVHPDEVHPPLAGTSQDGADENGDDDPKPGEPTSGLSTDDVPTTSGAAKGESSGASGS